MGVWHWSRSRGSIHRNGGFIRWSFYQIQGNACFHVNALLSDTCHSWNGVLQAVSWLFRLSSLGCTQVSQSQVSMFSCKGTRCLRKAGGEASWNTVVWGNFGLYLELNLTAKGPILTFNAKSLLILLSYPPATRVLPGCLLEVGKWGYGSLIRVLVHGTSLEVETIWPCLILGFTVSNLVLDLKFMVWSLFLFSSRLHQFNVWELDIIPSCLIQLIFLFTNTRHNGPSPGFLSFCKGCLQEKQSKLMPLQEDH